MNTINNNKIHKIISSDEFKKLVLRKRLVSLVFTIIMLTAYFGFILTIAFTKEFLSTKIGTTITYGLPIGLGLIILAWVLTGCYVYWANNKYDVQVNDLKKKIE